MSVQHRAQTWSSPTSPEQAYRRAGGRRHYNAKRSEAAFRRRMEVFSALYGSGRTGSRVLRHGDRAELARTLGVSRSTVCRDVKEVWRWMRITPCPTCDHTLTMDKAEELKRQGLLTKDGERVDPEAVRMLTTVTGVKKEGDREQLTPEFALQVGAWGTGSRVLAMGKDRDVAVTLAARRGDDADLLLVLWVLRYGGWVPTSIGVGSLDSPIPGVWADGPFTFAVGRSVPPGKGALLRHQGQLELCQPENGYWVFVRQLKKSDQMVAPEVLG